MRIYYWNRKDKVGVYSNTEDIASFKLTWQEILKKVYVSA